MSETRSIQILNYRTVKSSVVRARFDVLITTSILGEPFTLTLPHWRLSKNADIVLPAILVHKQRVLYDDVVCFCQIESCC